MAEGILGLDAYSPSEVAERVERVGVTKARLGLVPLFMLGVLAGGFIGLGALFFTLVASDPDLPFAVSRLVGGVAFSLGLILVVVAGAELFTGNNLLVMAWVDRRITTRELARNWGIVYLANAVGALGLVALVHLSGHAQLGGGIVGEEAVRIAAAKTSLSFRDAFFRGVLCNVLVCLAVWLAMAGRSVTDKILAILFPITAFVAAGFEHSIANMYLIPLGILLHASGTVPSAGPGDASDLDVAGFLANLVPVTLGNLFGGGVMVGLVYHFVYRSERLTGRSRGGT